MAIYYTNQTLEAFQQLQRDGVMRGKEDYIWEGFIPAYEWLKCQMKKRMPMHDDYPIWLWTKKPDLHHDGHFEKGTKAVCLTLDMPDEHVLLSDFQAWHCVLGDYFCSLTAEEDELFEQGKLSITKEETWKRIFHLDLIRQSEVWKTSEQVIQGVSPLIRWEQIRDVDYFTAK